MTAVSADGTAHGVPYDFLVNAAGPSLQLDKTEGLGPEIERMRRGERRTLILGAGHGTCTCEGATFEYIVNLEFEPRRVRAAAPRRALQSRHHLDHQRIRARDRLGHTRARAEGGAGSHRVRDARRRRERTRV